MRIFHRPCWRRFARIFSTGWRCHGRAWWLCVLPPRLESVTRVAVFYPVLPRRSSWYFRITFSCTFFSRWAKEIGFRLGLPPGRQTFFLPALVSTYFIFALQISKRPALIRSPRGVWLRDEPASK